MGMIVRSAALCAAALLAACATSAPTDPGYTVAFSSMAPSDTDIFIATSDGLGERVLAQDPAIDINASFSADGEWVVFTSYRSGNADVYRIHRDGTGLEQLTDDPAFDDQGALSPDGRSLAFVSSRSGQADIWILDLASGDARNLTDAPTGEFRPTWSPDGRWLAFTSDRDATLTTCVGTTAPGPGPFVLPQVTGVFIVRPDGGELRRLTSTDEFAAGPRWSRDGSKIAYMSTGLDGICRGSLIFRSGPSQVATVDVATGARTEVTSGESLKLHPGWHAGSVDEPAYVGPDGLHLPDRDVVTPGAYERPDWSVDGSSMVFHRETDPRPNGDRYFNAWPSPEPSFALLRLPGQASYAPAGDRVAFVVGTFDGGVRLGNLMVADAGGATRTTLRQAAPGADITGPSWAPNEDTILFGEGGFLRAADTQTAKLRSIAPDGSALADVTSGEFNDGFPSFSPDGREVVFRTASGPNRALAILNLATGERRPLPGTGALDTFPTWSPQGDWISFTSRRDGDYDIYRVRPDGTGLEQLTDLEGSDAHGEFSPDGEWIAFATSVQGFKDEAIGLTAASNPPFQPYGEIAVMRADGSDFRILTDNSTEEGAPTWVRSLRE